jgi:hypothetical protein
MSEMIERATLNCFRCDRLLNNITPSGVQPVDGLAFHSYGHYGTSYFDPLDGTCIQIAVCDECLEDRAACIIGPSGYNARYDWSAIDDAALKEKHDE